MRVNIGKLVGLHHRTTGADGLSRNLGDGFLLEHNAVYRNVRRGALAAGFRFSHASFPGHQVFPLSTLHSFLEKKTIPYADNVSVLEDLAARSKTVFLETDFEMLAKNFVFHEAAHACAYSIHRQRLSAPANASEHELRRRTIVHTMLEESYANAVEIFACHEMHSQTHGVFLAYNNYALPRLKLPIRKVTAPKQARRLRFVMLQLSYLHANFLYRELGADEFERALELAQAVTGVTVPGPTPARRVELAVLAKYFQLGLTLNPVARLITADFYYRLMGMTPNLRKNLDFDFMRIIEADDAFQASIAEGMRLVLDGG